MQVPSRQNAEDYLSEAEKLNPGPWISHSRYVAEAARIIASHHPRLDPDIAFIMGLLHDIGRREGVTSLRHSIDGYNFLHRKGYKDAARICITHMFATPNIEEPEGCWDCTQRELEVVKDCLAKTDFTKYDRLIQLSDLVAMPNGFCLIEKRLIDVGLRYGVGEYTVPRWKARFEIQRDFEQELGRSIYRLLPGVIENTFGFTA